MSKLKILELFGGIGACSKALEKLEIDYEISDYVEIDKYAVKSFNAIHNTNFEPQDICKWDKDIEVYRTGKVYFKDFPVKSGMSINDILKALKIAKKELRKQKIRTWFKSC